MLDTRRYDRPSTLDGLLSDEGFLELVRELNAIVSAPGDMIEGNVYYANEHTLVGKEIDREYARYRSGFVEALSGRSRLLEIGFNAGHSALTYFYTNPLSTYVGIDLAYRPYTVAAIAWFQKKFGDRFTLHVGDSTQVLPSIEDQIGKFDAIHVDGGHTFDVAFADIWNCYRLLEDDGVMIVDDRPAPEVGRAIELTLKTRMLRPLPMDDVYRLGFQAYLEKDPVLRG